ncbi:hypothetical protein N7470_007011 [Penicillium chermesinum]|nr:hypothetical protein N7470_007011 [Penicillium chermesinum]
MATTTQTLPAVKAQGIDLTKFPDGLKTSGQHAPIYDKVWPYSKFPKRQTGPTLWKAEDYRDNPEKWTHKTAIPDGHFKARLEALRKDLLDGKGFWLFKGIPVTEWDLQKCATAYMGLGTYLGYFTSQNGRGHVLGHVKDLGEDPTQTDRVRIYRTNARQYFHTDGSDIVGLLCIAKSLSGGESDIVSTHHVFNTLQERHPDVVETLVTPNWYFDRKGEVSEGQEPWYRGAVMYMENERSDNPRVYARFDPNNVTSLKRYNSGPNALIPPLSEKQKYAMEIFEKTCAELALHMILAPGDIQITPPGAVDENGRPARRRHLMRLWLSAPESEGGWKTPYADALEQKRGGIQVNDQPPHCPLDAE